jgi:hypothetical protein
MGTIILLGKRSPSFGAETAQIEPNAIAIKTQPTIINVLKFFLFMPLPSLHEGRLSPCPSAIAIPPLYLGCSYRFEILCKTTESSQVQHSTL